MPPDLNDFAIHAITLTPQQGLGIPVALVGAVFLALGAQFQHRGVNKMEALTVGPARSGLSTHQLLLLLRRPSWVIGTLMLGLAVAFQLTSLALAPLIVVQPLGAIALVITAIVNARISKVRLERASIRAIVLCVGGIGIFVTIAAFTATSSPVTEGQLIAILIILAVVTIAFALFFAYLRNRFKAIVYILGAGVLYGFVATLAKVVIDRIKTLFIPTFHIGELEWLTV
ncbi:MAG TPA: DMT family transporter, partial [Terrimesophilobacter sp.]|nr:DMT family transporter [Terrimesophilobacter sp.]